MRSVNKVILMGNLVAAPELRTTTTGKAVSSFAVATNNEWRNERGEPQKSVDFHRIIAWQSLAESCAKLLQKGSPIYVEGRIHNRSYEDADKKRHYVTEITAERVNFIQTKRTKEGEKVGIEETESETEKELATA